MSASTAGSDERHRRGRGRNHMQPIVLPMHPLLNLEFHSRLRMNVI